MSNQEPMNNLIQHASSKNRPRIMIGIPAYNEAENVEKTVISVKPFCDHVLVVDDGSNDNTAEIAENTGAEVIIHKTNEGYGGALRTIFQTAQKYLPEILVILDSDGQHNPNDVPRFVRKIDEGYDVVIGSRFLNKEGIEKIPKYRKVGMKILDHVTMMATPNIHVSDSQCGFRAYAKSAYSAIHLSKDGMSAGSEILVQLSDLGMKIGEIPIEVRYDVEDASSQNPIKHGLSVLISVMRFVTLKRPVLTFGLPGFAILIIGTILAVLAFDVSARTGIWSTNITLMAAMMLMFGMLLCVSAILLYYISEMIREIKRLVQ